MSEMKVVQTDPITVAYLPMTGPYTQMPEAYDKLYGWVQSAGLVPMGMPQAVYLTSPQETPEDQAVWELWGPVSAEAEQRHVDESGVGIKRVPPESVAVAMHVGTYDSVESTYHELAAWVEEQGLQFAGPPREVYLSDPEEVPPEETLTEILFPVSEE